MFGHTLRGWLAESLELVASRKTFPYKNYHLEPVSFDGFINYYRLNASESRDNKIIVYVFLFFFCIKSKTGALCLITVSLLTKPPWPSKHKMSFCQWAASCGFVFWSEPVEKWFGLWKIQAFARLLGNFKFLNLQINIKYWEFWIKCIY